MAISIPAFTLYGLVGCQHCSEAEMFLRTKRLPFILVLANSDPVADLGVRQLTGKDEYPVLIYKPTKEYVVGFKQDQYERLANAFDTLIGANAVSVFGSQQQPVGQTTQSTQAS